MKPFTILFISLALFSCNKDRHVILRLVNSGNDGWDAFSIFLYDDSTYSVDDIPSDNTGKYTIQDTVIHLGSSKPGGQKIMFNKTALGCMYNVHYVSDNRVTDMRVIDDNLCCKSITKKSLEGIWECDLSPYGTDTLQLNANNTAHWRDTDFSLWEVNNAELILNKGDHWDYLLILDIQKDTLWYSSQTIRGEFGATKAIRLHEAK
jgi:hypothetical protein